MTRTAIACLILVLINCLPANAAGDFELWTEAGVRYEINKQLSLTFDQHLRFHKDASDVKSIMPELAVSYRPLKFLRLEAGFRYEIEPDEDNGDTYADPWYRFFADVRLRLRLKPVTLRYRLRIQEQFGWPWDKNNNRTEYKNRFSLRNKLELELKLGGGFEPFVSTEIFNRLGEQASERNQEWHIWRFTIGLEYTVNSHKFALSYLVERFLSGDTWGNNRHEEGDMNHILALGYHFSF